MFLFRVVPLFYLKMFYLIWAETRCPVQFSFDKPLDFVHTCLLVIMDPPNSIELCDLPNIIRELAFDCGKFELLIKDRNDIFLILKSAMQLFVNPIFAIVIIQKPIERVRGKDENEMLGCLDVFEKMGVEFSSIEFIDVDEYLNR